VLRARGRCEYCGLAQDGQEAEFHVDHIVPLADAGATELKNLALACVSCSLRQAVRRHSFTLAATYGQRTFGGGEIE
jgi:5-methylcytosine-specific restriction endonuclease McrA